MIYILVALEAEVPGLRLPEGFSLVITGVGKVNAAHVTTKTVLKDYCSKVINYGTAGTLSPEFAGQFLRVREVHQRDMDARPLVALGETPFDAGPAPSAITLHDQGATLSTGDNFVTAPPEVATDLVDMEAYAIAKVCLSEGMPFESYKFVTDLADENATENWRDNVAKGVQAFQSFLDGYDPS